MSAHTAPCGLQMRATVIWSTDFLTERIIMLLVPVFNGFAITTVIPWVVRNSMIAIRST